MADYKHHVFLSYSREDEIIAETVLLKFRISNFLNVWIDKDNLLLGTENWRLSIGDAIENSGCIVVILSPDAKRSRWVNEELGYAKSHGKQVFPVLAKGDETNAIPFGYTESQWIDVRDETMLEPQLDKLLSSITRYLGIDSEEQKILRLRHESSRIFKSLAETPLSEVIDISSHSYIWISHDTTIKQAKSIFLAREYYPVIVVRQEGTHNWGLLYANNIFKYGSEDYDKPVETIIYRGDKMFTLSTRSTLLDTLYALRSFGNEIIPVVDDMNQPIALISQHIILDYLLKLIALKE
jgi:hypothetical protein